MSGNRKNDRPLLAARLRPYRRPPRPSHEGTGASGLRLSHGEPSSVDASARSDAVSIALGRGEATAAALHAALESYARIIADVSLVEQQVRRVLDSEDVAALAPTVMNEVARILYAVDREAKGAASDGAALLDGQWGADLLDAYGRVAERVTLPRIRCDLLGSDSVGGRLSSLILQSDYLRLRDDPAVALAIVRSAALWLAGERERVFRLLADVIEPLVAELEIIEANACAAQTAGDAEIAADLAHITKLHALANAAPIQPARSERCAGDHGAAPFRLRHAHDDSDGSAD